MKFTLEQTNFLIDIVLNLQKAKTKLSLALPGQFNTHFKTNYSYKQLYNKFDRAKNSKV
jgi:hypothetical protein